MELKINKKIDIKFFEVSYGDGDIKIIYIAKTKKQVKEAEDASCGLEDLDYIKELPLSEINRKRKIGKKLLSFKSQALLVLERDGFSIPTQIASAGVF